MKKLLFSASLIVANFAFGQLTLEHSFTEERTLAYSTPSETYYVSKTVDNKLKIYNSNYTLYKTVNVPMPANYSVLSFASDNLDYIISKNIFNTDSKFEFLIAVYNYNNNSNSYETKLLLINEDGTLLKDFNPNPASISYAEKFEIFHDSVLNVNKLVVHNESYITTINYNPIPQTDVYALPTSVLTTKEIQAGTKLSAFPIPTNKILNIVNPGNGANKIQVYDTTGKLVVDKSFSTSENKISIDVENLPKGIYIYKVGELSSKFTKN